MVNSITSGAPGRKLFTPYLPFVTSMRALENNKGHDEQTNDLGKKNSDNAIYNICFFPFLLTIVALISSRVMSKCLMVIVFCLGLQHCKYFAERIAVVVNASEPTTCFCGRVFQWPNTQTPVV